MDAVFIPPPSCRPDPSKLDEKFPAQTGVIGYGWDGRHIIRRPVVFFFRAPGARAAPSRPPRTKGSRRSSTSARPSGRTSRGATSSGAPLAWPSTGTFCYGYFLCVEAPIVLPSLFCAPTHFFHEVISQWWTLRNSVIVLLAEKV